MAVSIHRFIISGFSEFCEIGATGVRQHVPEILDVAGSKKRSCAARTFTGVLTKPIRIKLLAPTISGLATEEVEHRNAEAVAAAIKTVLGKVDALFEHFDIQRSGGEGEWASLALQMAREFVPGFQIVAGEKRGRGRPKNSALEPIRLLADLELVKRSNPRPDGRSMSDAKAAVKLTQELPYKKRWGHLTPQAIRNRLSQARDPQRNPFAKLWQADGEVGVLARETFIELFGISKNAG